VPIHLEVVLHEEVWDVLPIAQVQQRGDARGDGQTKQFVRNRAARAIGTIRGTGELPAEIEGAVWIRDLKNIELAPASIPTTFTKGILKRGS